LNYFFITGTSRGIGKALAELLLSSNDNFVYGISRSCTITHPRYNHFSLDLSQQDSVDKFDFPLLTDAGKIGLINNSGMIGEVRYAGEMKADEINRTVQLNLTAPILLSNAFLNAYSAQTCDQIILQISSGAAQNPIDGWSVYCATKAGLDHYARTLSAEQKLAGKEHIHVFSVAPGIVDTAMQDQIRTAESQHFSRIEQFISYKKSDQLADPAVVAAKILTILDSPKKFGNSVFSVKDF
jgi:benzil reductase ((S)-benzoin forming)